MHETSSPTSQLMNQSTSNSFDNYLRKSNNGRAGVQIDTYKSNPYSNQSSHNYDAKYLTMTKSSNPHENGLHRSAHLCELREKEEPQNRKADTTYGTVAATKVAFGVFSLFDLASTVTIPKHRINMNTTFTETVMNMFHEVKEIYDVTLNKNPH